MADILRTDNIIGYTKSMYIKVVVPLTVNVTNNTNRSYAYILLYIKTNILR